MELQILKTDLNYDIKLPPILTKKRITPIFENWVDDNKEDLIELYKIITNYNKDMNFLNECTFSIFCSFCYQKSF